MSTQLISKLGEGILADARREAAKKIEDAKREAQDILAKAKEKAMKEVENIRSKTEEEAKLLQSQSMSQARREAALELLKEKDNLMSQAFQKASQRLGNMSNKHYIESLVKLINSASSRIGDKTLKVKLNRRDLTYQNEIVKKLNAPDLKLKFDKETLNSLGGCIILSQDEKVKIDETYEVRLAIAERTLKKTLAQTLFSS